MTKTKGVLSVSFAFDWSIITNITHGVSWIITVKDIFYKKESKNYSGILNGES